MTSPTLLTTFRVIRDHVADIQHTATAIDEHLGRFQIYDSEEDLALAIALAEGLAVHVEQLESDLRRCARRVESTHKAEVRVGEPAPIHALSATSV